MGLAVGLFLCVFVGRFVTVQSVINQQVAVFSHDFPGYVENLMSFPLGNNFDFTPYDTVLGSLRTWSPDFRRLAELPSTVILPRVQVLCDESKLTLLVDKRSSDIALSADNMQLGYGCYSNAELPKHFVFTYSVDQCGTTYVMQNGLKMFTNTLYLNPKKHFPNSKQTPSTMHISCIPKRSSKHPNYFTSPALPEIDNSLNMKAMNPSWTSTADSNVYERGQVVHLQVSAKLRADQQLFIQSCFVSGSPNPQTRPKQAVIINKGCAVLGSHDVQFVASNRSDVVNFVLNTFYLTSEVYIHCNVLISDQGITFGSKSCNYNMINSRWEELSGDVGVCECCSHKCKGLSVKRLPEDAKAVVSTGPFIFVGKDVEESRDVSEPEETVTGSSYVNDNSVLSGTSESRSAFSSAPQEVVIVNQDPDTRLTLWLAGQEQDAEQSHYIPSPFEDNLTPQSTVDDSAELQPSTTDQESLLNPLTNTVNWLDSDERKYDPNVHMLLGEWPVPHLDGTSIEEGFQRKNDYGGYGKFGPEALQDAEDPTVEMNMNDFNHMEDDVAQMQADSPVMPLEERNDVQPIIRSKIQYSKGRDGSQMLSYEEEVVKTQEGDAGMRCGMGSTQTKREPGQKGLYSTFLNLLRGMDKAE